MRQLDGLVLVDAENATVRETTENDLVVNGRVGDVWESREWNGYLAMKVDHS